MPMWNWIQKQSIRLERSLNQGDSLYVTADTFFKSYYPLYLNGSQIGKIGVVYQQSVFNIKLVDSGPDEQPISNIRVLVNPPPKRFPVPVKPEVKRQPIREGNCIL